MSRGNVWKCKGEHGEAIADLDQALRLKPHYAQAYRSRGKIWDKKGEYDKAIADFNQALRFDSHCAGAVLRPRYCLEQDREA